jgi:micrococcal nuclease
VRVLLAAALLALFPSPGCAMSGKPATVPVVFVADGDTVRVEYRGKREWVRLLRIDTPERDEAGYGEARDALRGLVEGREVTLVFEDPGIEERDVHGRLLGYLFRDGENLNVEMIRAGWSPFWTRYGEGRFAEEFRRAEGEAREAGRGLWGEIHRRKSGALLPLPVDTPHVWARIFIRYQYLSQGVSHSRREDRWKC